MLSLQYSSDPSLSPLKGEIRKPKEMTTSNYKSGFGMHYDASQHIQARAKELRKRLTRTEKLLWDKLKNQQVLGYKFRRQHPIMIFIVDFYCHKAKLIIEVDGPIHNLKENKEYDRGRSFELEEKGLTVIRFTNFEVENNINKVINEIEKQLENKIL